MSTRNMLQNYPVKHFCKLQRWVNEKRDNTTFISLLISLYISVNETNMMHTLLCHVQHGVWKSTLYLTRGGRSTLGWWGPGKVTIYLKCATMKSLKQT